MKLKIVSLALALSALASCTQYGPAPLHGVRPTTDDVYTNRHDVKMVCGRAHGESYGFNLLGFIPISSASEVEAIDRMYENARKRGATLEGPRQFVNTSYEKSANYFLLGSMPVVRVAADLVEIQHDGTTPGGATMPAAEQKEEKSDTGIGALLLAPYQMIGGIFSSIFGS